MESVIERGQARCPRCVAVADYLFVEISTNLLRYEVNCGRCGETYREEHGPVPPTFGAPAVVDEWHPQPAVPVLQRINAHVTAIGARLPNPAAVKLVTSGLLLRLTLALYQ